MDRPVNQYSLLRMLIISTVLMVLTQIVFLSVGSLTSKFLDTTFSTSLTKSILTSAIFIWPLLGLIAAQLGLYALFIYIIWYVATGCGQWFRCSYQTMRLLGVSLWINGIVGCFAANCYWVHQSFFAKAVRFTVLNNTLGDTDFYRIMMATGSIMLLSKWDCWYEFIC